jgi:zinc protease
VERARLPGAITISTYTKTETTVPAVDLALEVLKRFNQNGISAEQLASAKAYVKGTFPTTRLETMDQLATVISEMEMYGQTRDEIDSYFERIDAVTLDTANAAIKKYYQTQNLTVVLLGSAQRVRGEVEKYGPGLKVVSIKTPGWR